MDDLNFDLGANPSRRNMLRMGAAGAAAFGGLQLAQIGGSTPARAQSGKALTVAVVAQQMSAQSDQRSWAGLQQWLKNTGNDKKWHVSLTDAKGDPGALVSQLEDAITRKVDAILVMYGTLTAAHSALTDLTRSKIPFFSLDSGWQQPAVGDLTSNNYDMGSKTSQFMVDKLLSQGKSTANICAIIADFHHGTRKRGKVMRTVLTENDWITLKGERVIQYSGFYETTQNTVNDWITRYGDSLDAIWCPWDEPAMAAAEVIMSHKLEKKIFVIGHDGHPTALERMRQPNYPLVATVAQAFELWGAYTGWLIEEIVGKGRSAKSVVPIPSIEFPAPLVVAGTNLPPAHKSTWDATDLYYVYLDRAKGGDEGVAMANEIALEARGIGKTFAGTTALADVDLTLRGGEMLALVGANGAGKTTLVKIICGVQAADSGEIRVNGSVVHFTNVADALAAGIAVAHQQVAIIPRLNGAQNIMLGREPLNAGFIRAKTLRREAQAIAQRFGVEIDLQRECSSLGLGETKILDILKALAHKPSILILDEPTASLTLNETRRLFSFLADLKAQGLAIVFISHHLNEVFDHCDRVTVLKDGRRVYDGPVAALSRAELVQLMVGRAIEDTDWQSHAAADNVVVSLLDARIAKLDVPEFSVHRGEVVGVAGVLGAGQTEFLERLAGVTHPTHAATAKVGALRHLPTCVKQAVENAIYLIADNRLRNAIFPSLSVEENLMTGSLGLVSRPGFMNKRTGSDAARGLIEQLRIKCSGTGQNVMQLSGGNQQKVAFGRWIGRVKHTAKSSQPVFLLDNPTEGVDVGSKAELYGIIRDFARGGGAVVISSSEFAELQKLCDRVYSIANGTLGKPLTRADISEDRLLLEVS